MTDVRVLRHIFHNFIKEDPYMKKMLSILLALAMLISMVPMAMADDVIELDMYFPVSVGGGPDALINALCEEFHAEYPGIKINPVYAGSYADTRTKVLAAIQAKNTPAIALMFSIDLYQLLSTGKLYDYNSFCTTPEDQEWLNSFYPGFMENSRIPDGNGGYTVYGIPSVFYGDEVGVEGYHDPFCRMPFPWSDMNNGYRGELLSYYRLLGEIRENNPVLADGDFYIVKHDESSIAYVRENATDRILVIANRGDSFTFDIPEGERYCDLLCGKSYENSIYVPCDSVMILKL